jgi:hypothetical protein
MNDGKSTVGSRLYDQPETDQAERRAVLRSDREAREAHATYHAMALGSSDAEGGPAVTGASKPQLAVPQWSRDLATLPKERPLGIDINAVEDTEACWWEPDAVGPRGGQSDEA